MSIYKSWQPLKPGTIVDIIAPGFATPKEDLAIVTDVLTHWDLIPRIPKDIYGTDLICANSDEKRFSLLKYALYNQESKAVWAIKGGYGSARLIPDLSALPPPAQVKLFMGFSDITALHLFLQTRWHWQTLHSAGPPRHANSELVNSTHIKELKNIIFGRQKTIQYDLEPLNNMAQDCATIDAIITGGNLSLVQTSIGTLWQVDAVDKILFMEEVNERAYRIDRMLNHLKQANIFNKVKAILLGDVTGGQEANGTSLVKPILSRFAAENRFPVFACPGIGHDKINRSLPLGVKALLQSGKAATLTITLNY